MSNLFSDDQQKIKKGRKNKFKDSDDLTVTASPRDRLLEDLVKKTEKKDFGKLVVEKWYQANSDRREWMDRQRQYLQSWDEHLPSSDQGPFEGSSNLHLPLPLMVAKTLHARFLQALIGEEPFLQARSRTEALVERQSIVEDVMMYYLKDKANYEDGAIKAIDDWVWDWITVGSGILKIRWEEKFERWVDLEDTYEIDESEIDINEEGMEVTAPKFIEKEEPIVREEKIFEGPIFETINYEDIAIVKGDGDPQKADFVMERLYLTASDLWTLADRGIFRNKVVENAIKGGKDVQYGVMNADIKQQRDRNSGHDTNLKEVELDRYEVLEAYINADVDGSGINSKIVLWVHVQSKEILGANYLRRMHKSGKVPYFKADFHRRRNQEHGTGIIEIIYPLSTEMDALHNMRIDFGLLATMPFGFYRPTSSLEPETLSLEPGALIPVDNPQTDINFPNLGNRTAFGFNEEAALTRMIERLTGVNDMTLGMVGQQGAARTATGARALMGESNANLDVFLRRLHVAWRPALKFLFAMLQQRMPEGLEFRLTGEDGRDIFRRINSREEFQGNFDIEIDGNSAVSNPSIRIANADTIAQLQQDMIAIQLGIIGPAEIYEGKKNQLRARGIKDVHRYLRPPEQARIFTPKEVVNRVLRGVDTPVTMDADHEGIIAYITEILSKPELLQRFSEVEAQALAVKLQQHQQMLEALQQLQAQQRNMMQAQMNAEQSMSQTGQAQQAPAASGPVEE